jgi:hypothetical protein
VPSLSSERAEFSWEILLLAGARRKVGEPVEAVADIAVEELCLDVFREETRNDPPARTCATSNREDILEGIGGGECVVGW